ncbi:PKD domain-containing protein [Nanoarchaeota archaeon]
MKNSKSRVFLVLMGLFLLFVSLSFVIADFDMGKKSHKLDSTYIGVGESILGWINISFDSEPGDSEFIDSWGNKISLLNLLRSDVALVEGDDYECSLDDCASDYFATNPNAQKILSLSADDEKVLGFKFTDDLTAIDSVKFTVVSNAGPACENQLKIDIGDDGTIDKGNNKGSSTICGASKSYGCYDPSSNTNEYSIGYFPNRHCQKIELSASPGFRIGAWVKKGSDTREFQMGLYTKNGQKLLDQRCDLPSAPVNGGEVSCNIDLVLTEPEDYYVCIYSDEGTGTAKVKGYADSKKGCGFYGTNTQPGNAAFQIFAEGEKYNSVGTLQITNALEFGGNLGQLVESYIDNKYGTLDCSDKGCVVPINFISSIAQQVTVKNLEISYGTVLGGVIENKFYSVDQVVASDISSDFIQISLDNASFIAPDSTGEETFVLELDGEEIFSEEINVSNLPKIKLLKPTNTSSALPTTFEVEVEKAEANLSSYDWDFGDNITATTTVGKISHVYAATGVYDLTLVVKDKQGFEATKTFEITVGSPKEIINKTLIQLKKAISNTKLNIEEFPEFYQTGLNSVVGIEEIEGELARLESKYETQAIDEEDYNQILIDLMQLEVPLSISTTIEAQSFRFYPDKFNIDLEILSTASGEEYNSDKRFEYEDSILAWNHQELETRVSFKELSASYGTESIPVLRVFEITTREKTSQDKSPYLILEKLDDLEFDQDYLEKEINDYVAIVLEQSEETIIFSTTQDVDFEDLPMFISPRISELVIHTGEPPIVEPLIGKWIIAVMILVLLLLLGIGAYIALQIWYKKKYESYLFKNKTNLYNLVTYVHNSKNKGLSNPEISSKLRKSGWRQEQIAYVMKKYAGKRTGLAEIPIDKILGRNKKEPLSQGRPMGKETGYQYKGYRRI